MEKTLQVRFNTENKGTLCWRVIIEGEEFLADEVRLFVPTFTTKDTLPDGRVKHHISCYYVSAKWYGTVLHVN